MVSETETLVGSPTRGFFNEWLAQRKRPITVGSSRHAPLEVLMDDDNERVYEMVYARWAARQKGKVQLDRG